MADRYLCCEGDTDRAVFEHLNTGPGKFEVLPKKPKPCTVADAPAPPPPEGQSAALRNAMALLRQGVPQVMLALDLDRGSSGDVFTRVERTLREENISCAGSAGRYEISGTVLSVLPVGLDSSQLLQRLGVASHSMDDFVVTLLLEQSVYESLVAAG